MKNDVNKNIPAEKFKFVGGDNASHDVKFDTKARSYFQDAFSRFCRNKGSVVAAVVIIILVLFAIIVPFFTPFTVAYEDNNFAYALPKNPWFEDTNFWDGCKEVADGEDTFRYYYLIGEELKDAKEGNGGHSVVKNQKYTKNENGLYVYRRDSYHIKGCEYKTIQKDVYYDIIRYQNETKNQVLYPLIDQDDRPSATQDADNANYYYKTKTQNRRTVADLDENGNPVPVYYRVEEGKTDSLNWTLPYDSIRIEGQDGIEVDGKTYFYSYGFEKAGGLVEVRVNCYEYYVYRHTQVIKDKISEPYFLLGATHAGKDILTCLSSGARFSFIFAIAVAVVNMFISAIWGAIAGYYGGTADIVMERITDVLAAIPMMVVITLLKFYLDKTPTFLILFLSFIATGWIGVAGTTRMQFYRFKNQEYVLAARTLGANDRRIMFKHIFPNALGTLVTSIALVIPSMIFSETSLTYLGIIDLSVGNITSVGTLIAAGQPYLADYPHIVASPSIFLALLMLSFNLFGNGLRDAFNPSLRGSED